MKPFDWLKAWPLYPFVFSNLFWLGGFYVVYHQDPTKIAAFVMALGLYLSPQVFLWLLARKYYSK